MRKQYKVSTHYGHYIDKTDRLQKGIEVFPSIYIEGAAASGKTTAVEMLLANREYVVPYVFFMEKEGQNPERLLEELQEVREMIWENSRKPIWLIFENMNQKLSADILAAMMGTLDCMNSEDRILWISREKPPEEFLELLWKRKMEMIPQNAFLFSLKEVRTLIKERKSMLNPEMLYAATGGWAGSTDLMIRMSEWSGEQDVKALRNSYEIRTYITGEILCSLSQEEQELVRRAAVCPWINEKLIREVWGMPCRAELLESLERKGLLCRTKTDRRWRLASLFRETDEGEMFQQDLGRWYEAQGCIREAAECIKNSRNGEEQTRFIEKYYAQIPFLGTSYREFLKWKEDSAEMIYLRGLYACFVLNQNGLREEIRKLEKQNRKDKTSREVYLNLTYLNTEVSLEQWLQLLESLTEEGETFQLYAALGGSVTFLCGFRDLTGLFVCTKAEENRKARIWKTKLGEQEWKIYQLARMDYYVETERQDALKEEDRRLLQEFVLKIKEIPWQFRLASFYLLHKGLSMGIKNIKMSWIDLLEHSLIEQEVSICIRNTVAVSNIFAVWRKKPEETTQWLCSMEEEKDVEIQEDNYYCLFCRTKVYLLVGQYAKAEKILEQMEEYLSTYKRYRYLAEVLFERALICWENGRHGQALQKVIESFVIAGDFRYIGFYTGYGRLGEKVLEAYVDWAKANVPEGWHRKKKYNYGNVLRMPKADYLELLLRRAKRQAGNQQPFQSEMSEEKLTMMETVVLQYINQGLSNQEICRELNLKLPTVKSHIYSLYKKLGVNSRVQAVLRGKEKGILR